MSSTVLKTHTIALVKADPLESQRLSDHLESEGLLCWQASSTEHFYLSLLKKSADLFVIDLGLPQNSGWLLLQRLTEHRCPVVAVAEKLGSAERVEAYRLGALQFFDKPLVVEELHAGVLALLSRLTGDVAFQPRFGWRLDEHVGALVTPDEQKVPLTSREHDLISCLLASPNVMVTKLELMAFTHQPNDADFHRLEAVLQRLRKKTLSLTGMNLPVRSVFGRGLVFMQTNQSTDSSALAESIGNQTQRSRKDSEIVLSTGLKR